MPEFVPAYPDFPLPPAVMNTHSSRQPFPPSRRIVTAMAYANILPLCMVTSSVLGSFRSSTATRNEFLTLIGRAKL
jgi:hypothetical protein